MSDNNIKVYLNTLRQKGYLAYEYNAFHNYQTDVDLYIYDDKYIIPEKCALNLKNGEILKSYRYDVNGNKYWIDKNGFIINDNYIEAGELGTSPYASAGSLIDLDTDKLNFDINHPVDIEVLPSYDGSVNLILNDNKNIPRLINSRFSAREKNTYEIVDRIGENDTNIYNSKTFDKDTSLYFLYETNPTIEYKGFVSGILPVGQYCFYFTYCDADDNESDFIAESGLIPAFIGGDSEPFSMNGGIKNENSNKGIKLKLSNIDRSYNYFKVYYVRYFADYLQNRVFEGKKIYKKYPINSSLVYLQITGYEEAEDIDPNIINLVRFNPKHILTQTLCKNMLFFGNIVKNTDNYRELLDCALRIIPRLKKENIEIPKYDYITEGKAGYYSSINSYNKVGYFNEEYYRFGVVFIYLNGTLSNVYNTLGLNLSLENDFEYSENSLFYNDESGIYQIRNYIKIDDDGWIKNYYTNNGNKNKIFNKSIQFINSKGVCKIDDLSNKISDKTIYGIEFEIPDEVQDYLKKELGIRGFFFVRQKCVPTLLALCYLLPMDETLKTPVLKYRLFKETTVYLTECFVTLGIKKKRKYALLGYTKEEEYIDEDRLIKNDYDLRIYKYKRKEGESETKLSKNAYAAICPDFLLNLPYYNQIFNGNKFTIRKITKDDYLEQDKNNPRFYRERDDFEDDKFLNREHSKYSNVTICTVTENVPTVALKDKTFKLNIGETEEAYRFGYAEIDNSTYDAGDNDYDTINKATNIVRGKYSPYLAIYSTEELETGELYNIYQEKDTNLNETQEYLNRMNSSEPFYSISDRYNFELINNKVLCWRGDCYINLFTYRLNRNFNDPSLPNNDQIIDKNTWKDNYVVLELEKWKDISRSDVNAVLLGSWITIRVRSGMNYALRSVDHSYVAEEALMGSPRSFYPKSELAWRGNNKLPDSYLYNDAFRASLGYKCYFTLLDINYIKDNFSNRIQYSAVSIQDSFKNNYRDSMSTYFRDYSQEYGSILKLVGFEGHLLVVFEHGIGLAAINERVLAGEGEGGPVFINTKNVLSEELTMITDTYGTQWPESVIKTESGNVYGVDTIAKKIWRIKGQLLEILSDFKVNKFLIENISLGERELYPIIGLKNVKTHYNNNKKDIMFTFYDDIYYEEEKVWNLCYNELLELFVTFYSWIPSYSENIDTKFFTFNRETSKCLSLLNKCNYNIDSNYGILLNTPIIDLDDYSIILPNNSKTYNDIGDVEWESVEPDNVNDVDWESISRDRINDSLWIRIVKSLLGEISSKGEIEVFYRDLCVSSATRLTKNDGTTILKSEYNPKFVPNVEFELLKDRQGNYKLFNLTTNGVYSIYVNNGLEVNTVVCDRWILTIKGDTAEDVYANIQELKNRFSKYKVIYLSILPKISSELDVNGLNENIKFKPETVAITLKSVLDNPGLTFSDYYEIDPLTNKLLVNNQGIKVRKQLLTSDFYLHGKAGIFNVEEDLYPTHWYGETHPFEFEFVVNDKIGQQKIFSNLVIISNKAEPESFHFEIEGDNYEFSSDKRTMYFRLEATKNLYQNLGSDILYNRKFTDVTATNYTLELYYRKYSDAEYENQYKKFDKVYPVSNEGLVQQIKSTIFPLYYERIDTYNDVYHKYHMMKDSDATYDFLNLSGSEIAWDRDLNLFNIVTHIKNSPIDLVGRLRGNSRYKEGKWNIQIPSIIFNLKNEYNLDGETLWPTRAYNDLLNDGPVNDWGGINKRIPPIVINSLYVPKDLIMPVITTKTLPNIYTGRLNHPDDNINLGDYIKINDNWTVRKEARIRDKWIKIRVRYSGKNLAIIHSLITLYNISYS